MKAPKPPRLRSPELRPPLFLVDLYYDLRDRRLLPLVALVAVAIVAAPFLLSAGSEEPAPPAAASPAPAPLARGAAKLAVGQSTSRLRDYRQRLRGRAPTDPFKQRYVGPPAGSAAATTGPEGSSYTIDTAAPSGGGAAPGGGSSAGGGPVSPAPVTPPPGAGSQPAPRPPRSEPAPPSAPGGQEKGGGDELTLYSFAADVRIVRTVTGPEGEKEKSAPTTRERVLPPAPLPGEKAQVVTYLGISPTTRKPLLLISDQVTATYGEGKCLSGASTCQLLEVETGMPVTFVYGAAGARYKLTVLKVEPVVSGHS